MVPEKVIFLKSFFPEQPLIKIIINRPIKIRTIILPLV